MTNKKPTKRNTWHQIQQQLRLMRRHRRGRIWYDAQRPQRQRMQQITRIVITPVIVVALVAIIYLGLQATIIQVHEYLTPPIKLVQIPTPIPNTPAPPAPQPPTQSETNITPTTASIPEITATIQSQAITHIVIPAIALDSAVVEVGWDTISDSNGQSNLVWQVAQYAVGHHFTSANPGQPNNIVLSGHVGGYGKVFRNLNQLRPNDQIMLMSGARVFTYVVQRQILVDEQYASPSEQIANLSYIENTPSEILTLITCWPPTGADRFSQRLIIRAVPLTQPIKN
jgi:LPXTG-site transpeptidase (sortase) family protein